MSASLIQPQVRRMIENEGVYITGSAGKPEWVVIMVSQGGKIYSVELDSELDPTRFLDDFEIRHGPLK